jgi:hypothetical protein
VKGKAMLVSTEPSLEGQFQQDLLRWLQAFVERPNSLLGNWSPCPYARQARLENRILIQYAPKSNFATVLSDSLENFDDHKWDAVVIGTTPDFPLEDMIRLRAQLRNQFAPHDLWPLFDHPEEADVVNGLRLNNPKYCLGIVQRLSKLVLASEQLKTKGYYDTWSEEDYLAMTASRKLALSRIQKPN